MKTVYPLDVRQQTSETPRVTSLRDMRLAVGLSIRKAADKIGISHGYLYDIEQGRRPVGRFLEIAREEYAKVKPRQT